MECVAQGTALKWEGIGYWLDPGLGAPCGAASCIDGTSVFRTMPGYRSVAAQHSAAQHMHTATTAARQTPLAPHPDNDIDQGQSKLPAFAATRTKTQQPHPPQPPHKDGLRYGCVRRMGIFLPIHCGSCSSFLSLSPWSAFSSSSLSSRHPSFPKWPCPRPTLLPTCPQQSDLAVGRPSVTPRHLLPHAPVTWSSAETSPKQTTSLDDKGQRRPPKAPRDWTRLDQRRSRKFMPAYPGEPDVRFPPSTSPRSSSEAAVGIASSRARGRGMYLCGGH
jgi:hypothetical protein